jgi:hypothetical protein
MSARLHACTPHRGRNTHRRRWADVCMALCTDGRHRRSFFADAMSRSDFCTRHGRPTGPAAGRSAAGRAAAGRAAADFLPRTTPSTPIHDARARAASAGFVPLGQSDGDVFMRALQPAQHAARCSRYRVPSLAHSRTAICLRCCTGAYPSLRRPPRQSRSTRC